MTENEKQRKYCGGCYNDYYNGQGAEKCWSLKDAKVVKKKFVHVDQRPPWTQAAVWTLSCHRKQRFVSVGPGVTR